MNARLRDNGVGLVPNVMEVDTKLRSAKVAAGAIEAFLTIPLGWHVIDDGRRTLVFDAGGKMQLNFDRRSSEGQPLEILAQSYIQPYVRQQPDLTTFAQVMQGIVIAGVADANIDGETLCQAFMLRPTPESDRVLVLRVTGDKDHFTRAMNLAGDMIYRAEFVSAVPAKAANDDMAEIDGPDWWKKAVALERKDELKQAEELIKRSEQSIGAFSQIAYMYELRMAQAAGRRPRRRDRGVPAGLRMADVLRLLRH
ncbi:MAG: hypothetical protein QM770_05295 [Tepidisphaeraceae bacterium]